MRIGVTGQRRCTAANDPGGGPATLVSRKRMAPKEAEEDDVFDLPDDEFSGAAIAIEREFRARVADIRKLPRRDRPGALRAAVDSRREALKALAEKRLAARRAQIADRRRFQALKRAAYRDEPRQ